MLVFVSIYLHLPRGRFGYVFLGHSHMAVAEHPEVSGYADVGQTPAGWAADATAYGKSGHEAFGCH